MSPWEANFLDIDFPFQTSVHGAVLDASGGSLFGKMKMGSWVIVCWQVLRLRGKRRQSFKGAPTCPAHLARVTICI
jgi:hypothetical protein